MACLYITSLSLWCHKLDIRIPLSLEFHSVNLRGREGSVIFSNKHPSPSLNTTAPCFLLMLHVECMCARMTLIVQRPGWWRLHRDAGFCNCYVRGRAKSALDHEYFYSEETHRTFTSSCISQSKSHASLTSKRDWEVQSYAVIRKEKAEIEGNHTNGYESQLEACRSISEITHSYTMLFWASFLAIKYQMGYYVCVGFGDSHLNKPLLTDATKKAYSKIKASQKRPTKSDL